MGGEKSALAYCTAASISGVKRFIPNAPCLAWHQNDLIVISSLLNDLLTTTKNKEKNIFVNYLKIRGEKNFWIETKIYDRSFLEFFSRIFDTSCKTAERPVT